MAYRSVQIPFARGQDERYDRKLVPDGVLRSANNMRLKRDGQYTRRQRLLSKGTTRGDGTTADAQTVMGFTRRGAIARDEEWNVYHERWTTAADGSGEVMERASGLHSTISGLERVYAEIDTSIDGTNFIGLNQRNAQVDVAFDGTIVFLYTVGRRYVLEFREPATLKVIARRGVDLGDENTSTLVARMVTSKATNTLAVSYYRNQGSSPGNISHVIETWDVTARAVTGDVVTLQSVTGTPPAGFFSQFDMAARPDEDSFLISRQQGSGGDYYLDEYAFSDLSKIQEVDTLTFASGPYYSTSITAGPKQGLWYWSVSECDHTSTSPTAGTLTFRGGEWGGAIVVSNATSSTYVSMAPAIVITSSDRLPHVVWQKLPGAVNSTSPTNVAESYITTWNLSAGTLGDETAYGAEIMLTHPIPAADGTGNGLSFLAEQAYYYAEDTGSSYVFEPFNPGNVMTYSPDEDALFVDGAAMVSGCRNWGITDGTGISGDETGPGGSLREAMYPRPVTYTHDGVTYAIYPATETTSDRGYSLVTGTTLNVDARSVWVRVAFEEVIHSTRSRDGEDTISGGLVRSCSESTVLNGFTGPPIFYFGRATNTNDPGETATASYEYLVTAILEYEDDLGRIIRSAPSPVRTLTTPAPAADFTNIINCCFACHSGVPDPSRRSRLAFYLSDANGTVLYRRGEAELFPGENATFSPGDDRQYETAQPGMPTIYTASELSNNAPPTCKFTALAKGRLWAGGLPDSSIVQASKYIRETNGIEWNELDSFKIFLPSEVTGIAGIDSSVIIFTRDFVYAVHGEGPTNNGVGAFSEPQLIPSSSGCINHLSVISTEIGVFYQSVRGVEIVPRGMASPQWIGQPVRDTIEQYPECKGVAYSTSDWSVRWLFSNGTSSVVVVYDQRAKAWYVFDYGTADSGAAFSKIGRNEGRPGNVEHDAMILGTTALSDSEIEDLDAGKEAVLADSAHLETGDLRFGAVQGWFSGRRLNILGQFGGRDCNVKVDMAFDGEDYLPQDTYTWNITSSEYGTDVPVELEIELPVQLFSSARFKLTVESTDDSGTNESFKLNGMAVYYTPRPEGPRLAARNTG